MTRVYLPATLGTLASAYAAGGFEAGYAVHAVTPAIREWYVEGDAEELEYAAFTEAAAASLHLLAADVTSDVAAADRRVVVAADVDDCAVRHVPSAGVVGGGQAVLGGWRSAAVVGVAVPVSVWASAHLDPVDDVAARSAVRAAITALPAAASGDDDALFALDEAESHELAWYDLSEIPDLI
jgi:hypothetical protein